MRPYARLDDPHYRGLVAAAFIVPPPSWIRLPAVALSVHIPSPYLVSSLSSFMLPGRWVLLHVWSGFFHPLPGLFPFARILAGLAGSYRLAWAFACFFSYFFWLIRSVAVLEVHRAVESVRVEDLPDARPHFLKMMSRHKRLVGEGN